MVAMYIEAVPNRSSPPAILLRESYRHDGKVRKRTLANLSKLPPPVIEGLRTLLRGGVAIEDLSEAVEVLDTWPWGHVGAVLGTARKLGLETLLSPAPCPERDRVMAMIVARVLDPASKLATARSLGEEAHLVALRTELGLEGVGSEPLYRALDWLYVRQEAIEERLARRHLEDGSLVLYDVTSSYFEGRSCPLAAFGHSRDGKKSKLQVVFGLLCNREGCPVAVEVFPGNTGDPATLKSQIDKVRERFGLQRVVFVGDRGLLTAARIREDLQGRDGVDWISALRTTDIRKLEALPGLQLSLFDERGFVELTDPAFPGERLVVCRNPLMADERARKREELLCATEAKLDEVVRATQRPKRPLRGQDKIALRVGRVVNDHKVAKHFVLEITETSFTYTRDEEKIAAEAALDGIYVVRTSLPESAMGAEEVVGSYKGLSTVERAFRSFKAVDLHVRPIHHYLPERVRAHIFLCMLAYYVEWHMRRRLAPLLFDDEDRAEAEALRDSIVAPAQVSASARRKAHTLRTADGLPVHSLRTLLQALSRLGKSRLRVRLADSEPIEKLAQATPLHEKAFSLLGLRL
jgi:transposase